MLCRILKKETIECVSEDVYDISVEKHHNFILANGTVVHNCDTYQSADLLQQLKAENFNCEIISVDRVDNESKICLPYQYFKSTIYETRISIYEAPLLTEELLGLERNNNGKIDHPMGGTAGSKDQSDAVCGAIWNASKHAEEFAFEFGETLDVITDVSNSSGEVNARKQIEIDMAEELNKLFDPIQNNQDDYFMDFGLGKAQPMSSAYLNSGIIVF